jgi:biopolymer transport protein ExbB
MRAFPLSLIAVLVVDVTGCAIATPCDNERDCPQNARCVVGRCEVSSSAAELLERDAAVDELARDEEGDDDDELILIPPGDGGGEGEDEPAGVFPGGFTHRRAITVRADAVPGLLNLKEFPLRMRIQADELRDVDNGGFVSRSGGDIAFFTNASMSEMLASDPIAYDGVSGTLDVWVRVDLSPYDDATIVIAYGRDETVPKTSHIVWSAYGSVWHLDGSANDAKGDNDGTAYNLEGDDIQGGIAGAGRRFDGGDETIEVPCGELGGSFSVTVEGWGKLDATDALSGFPRLFHMGGEARRVLELFVTDTQTGANTASFRVNHDETGMDPYEYISVGTGEWHHYAGVLNAITGNFSLFVDGEQLYETYYGGAIPSGYGTCHIGNWDASPILPRNWHGVVDEVRISRRSRPQEWFQALVENVRNPESFIVVGADETP